MSPEERAEGLAAAARVQRDALLALGNALADQHLIEVLNAPAAGSLVVELATEVGGFCLTEAIVTTASVRVDGRVGWASVAGWDDEAALAAAICDGWSDRSVEQLARDSLHQEAESRESEALAVARTGLNLG